mgnify:CR=1 FL=1
MTKFLKRKYTTTCLAIALCVALTGLWSCRSGRSTVAPEITPTQEVNFSPAEAYSTLVDSYKDWQDVEIPVKIELEQPTHFSASGKAVMVNGQVIAVTLRKFGFEAAKLYITPTEIVLISKPLRIAYRESMDLFAHYTGMNVADLQCALLGRLFIPGSGQATESMRKQFNMAALEGGRSWTLAAKRGNRPLVFTAVEEPADADGNIDVRLSQISVEAGGGVEIRMLQPQTTPFGLVPEKVDIDARYGSHALEAAFRWTPSQAKWNKNASVSVPEIPEGYRIIDTPKLISLLRSL